MPVAAGAVRMWGGDPCGRPQGMKLRLCNTITSATPTTPTTLVLLLYNRFQGGIMERPSLMGLLICGWERIKTCSIPYLNAMGTLVVARRGISSPVVKVQHAVNHLQFLWSPRRRTHLLASHE